MKNASKGGRPPVRWEKRYWSEAGGTGLRLEVLGRGEIIIPGILDAKVKVSTLGR